MSASAWTALQSQLSENPQPLPPEILQELNMGLVRQWADADAEFAQDVVYVDSSGRVVEDDILDALVLSCGRESIPPWFEYSKADARAALLDNSSQLVGLRGAVSEGVPPPLAACQALNDHLYKCWVESGSLDATSVVYTYPDTGRPVDDAHIDAMMGITLWYEQPVARESTARRDFTVSEESDVSTQNSNGGATNRKHFDGDLASLVLESCNVDLRQVLKVWRMTARVRASKKIVHSDTTSSALVMSDGERLLSDESLSEFEDEISTSERVLTEGSLKPVRARRGASQVDETAVNREMDTMRSKLADLRPALVKAEAENKEANATLATRKEQLSTVKTLLEGQARELENEAKQLEEELATLRDGLGQLEIDDRNLTSELRDATSRASKAAAMAAKATEERTMLQADVDVESSKAKMALERASKAREDALARKSAASQAKAAALSVSSECDSVKLACDRRIDKARTELDALQRQTDDLEAELVGMLGQEAELVKVEADAEAATSAAVIDTVAANDRAEQARVLAADAHARMKRIMAATHHADAARLAAEAACVDVSARLTEAAAERELLDEGKEGEISNLRQQIARLGASEHTSETRRAAALSKLDEMTNELSNIKPKVDAYRGEEVASREAARLCLDRAEKLDQACLKFDGALSDCFRRSRVHRDEVKERLQTVQFEHSQALSARDGANAHCLAAETALDAARAKRETLRKKAAAAASKRSAAEAEVVKIEAAVDRARQEFDASRSVLSAEVAAAESERAAASGVLARLRARCSVLAEKKDTEAAAIRQLQLESSSRRKRNAQLSLSLEEERKAVIVAEAELQRSAALLEEEAVAVESLQGSLRNSRKELNKQSTVDGTIQELQQHLSSLSTREAEAVALYTSATERACALRSELLSTQRQCREFEEQLILLRGNRNREWDQIATEIREKSGKIIQGMKM